MSNKTLLINDDLPAKPVTHVLAVRPCPHYKETHVGLIFHQLRNVSPNGSTHLAECPVTGEGILAKPPAGTTVFDSANGKRARRR